MVSRLTGIRRFIAIGLIGIMALWLGVMRLAERSGLVKILARLLRPVMTRLFPDVPAEHPAMDSMLMNISANMLGLATLCSTIAGITSVKLFQRLPFFKLPPIKDGEGAEGDASPEEDTDPAETEEAPDPAALTITGRILLALFGLFFIGLFAHQVMHPQVEDGAPTNGFINAVNAVSLLAVPFLLSSMIARMAATIFGSTETTFYVVTVYFGAVAIRKTRHAIAAGLTADLTGVIAAIIICRLVFG